MDGITKKDAHPWTYVLATLNKWQIEKAIPKKRSVMDHPTVVRLHNLDAYLHNLKNLELVLHYFMNFV